MLQEQILRLAVQWQSCQSSSRQHVKAPILVVGVAVCLHLGSLLGLFGLAYGRCVKWASVEWLILFA